MVHTTIVYSNYLKIFNDLNFITRCMYLNQPYNTAIRINGVINASGICDTGLIQDLKVFV